MSTESRNPRSFGLENMTAQEIVRLMNEEEYTVLQALQRVESELAAASERVAEAFQQGGRAIYVGAGTSGRVASMDAAEMPPTFGIDADRFVALIAGGGDAAAKSVEDAEDDEHQATLDLNNLGVTRQDVVIGLAASGRTPYVLAAVRHANQKGIWTCGIANNLDTPLTQTADLGIVLRTGPEVLTGSTRLKAGTAQKLALNRISTAAMVLSGKVVENLMVDVKAKNSKLKERCVRILRDLTTCTIDEAWEVLERHAWNVREALDEVRTAASASKAFES